MAGRRHLHIHEYGKAEIVVILLGITANIPAWAAFITPILTGVEWLFAAIGLVGGVGTFALQGAEWLQNRSQWGHLLMGVLGGVLGVGFAAGAVAMGQTIGGAIAF